MRGLTFLVVLAVIGVGYASPLIRLNEIVASRVFGVTTSTTTTPQPEVRRVTINSKATVSTNVKVPEIKIPSINSLVNQAQNKLEVVKEDAASALKQAQSKAEILANDAKKQFQNAKGEVSQIADDLEEKAKGKLSGLMDNVETWKEEAMAKYEDLVNSINDLDLKDKAVEKYEAMKNKWEKYTKGEWGQKVKSWKNSLKAKMNSFEESMEDKMAAAWAQASKYVPDSLEGKIEVNKNKIVNAWNTEAAPKIQEAKEKLSEYKGKLQGWFSKIRN